MELHPPIYDIALILLVGFTINSQVLASMLTPEMYWKNALPNTPMPSAIQNSLQSVAHGFVIYPRGPPPYELPATQKEVDDYVNKFGETYMLETQMIPGRIIQVRLQTHADNKATFLPRKDSDSIPFSPDKLSEILNIFSIQPRSKESVVVEETINNCEKQHEGEDKLCATSLEAMVSFAKSKLGDLLNPISSNSMDRDGKIKYRITGVNKLVDYGSPVVVCHKEQYPYAVFSCHQVEMTAVYVLSMVGNEVDNVVEVAAVCHKDTSWWSPKHMSFQLLKVKPGKTTPVCHFLNDLSVVWTNK